MVRLPCFALALTLALPALAPARPANFSFNDVEVRAILQTAAVMGKFNVLVAPDLTERLTFKRADVEPLEVVQEVAKLVGATVRAVRGPELVLWVVTRKPLPDALATPAALPGQVPTDFNFEGTQLRAVAATMGVLGHFDAAVAPPLDAIPLTFSAKQVLPNQLLYWVAAVTGGTVEESTASSGRKLLMVKPAPVR